MSDFWVNGIVAVRDKQPYIQLSDANGIFAQLTVNEARQIAHDIMLMASRTEADALLLTFVEEMDLGEQAGSLMMQAFRDFRAKLDNEKTSRPIEDSTDV